MSRKTHIPQGDTPTKQRRILRREAKLKAACPTGKRRYKDEASALVALERIQRTDDPRRTKTPQRAYFHEACAGWHLSSKSWSPSRQPLPRRSKKMQDAYRKSRIPLVIEVLAERPWCEIRFDENCTGRATTLHEVKKRSRGGDITNKKNVLSACAYCNGAVEDHPEEAHARGFAAYSWEDQAS